jgi:hypothetical protein
MNVAFRMGWEGKWSPKIKRLGLRGVSNVGAMSGCAVLFKIGIPKGY